MCRDRLQHATLVADNAPATDKALSGDRLEHATLALATDKALYMEEALELDKALDMDNIHLVRIRTVMPQRTYMVAV